MTSLQQKQPINSVSDERKRKKLISNRESAHGATQASAEVSSENNVLRAQLTALTDRLQSLNNVLYVAQEVSDRAMDIPEVPNTLLEPWQLPCPVQPITASNISMFQY
ncbi:hypothetical protein L1987_03676 [Smallanthus sonchifolius]|uniref:Uncharacterized protein n=1 Tax=Smallanthus sonchifolius TaxID=185202 RepID=A0ACB9KBJ5_9ASTR|nr:hypothetical protein L1987_03676 [Smallanthus sonchifolius]